MFKVTDYAALTLDNTVKDTKRIEKEMEKLDKEMAVLDAKKAKLELQQENLLYIKNSI